MNGARQLVAILKAHGVQHVSVLCGNGLNSFLQACNDEGIRLVDTRNEQAAAYIADTWGAMTGRLGVVAVSAGPGHTNALTGLTNAWWDGRPMLLISGCSEAQTRGLGHFQELDQVSMAAPATKYARLVERPEQLAPEVEKAIQIALCGRPGPVHLTITGDVMEGELPAPVPNPPAGRTCAGVKAPLDPDLLARAADLIAGARRPVFVAGSGCFYAGAGSALQALLDATGIPLFSLMWDRCCVDGHWPQYVGPSTAECNGAFPLLAQADVIVTLGARVDFRLGYGQPPVCAADARFIRVDVEPGELAHGRSELSLRADPASFAAALEGRLTGITRPDPWLAELHAARKAFIARWDGRLCELETPLPAPCIMRTLKPFLERDITFLLDGGNIGRWAHMLMWDRHPSFWHTCGTSGVVGWGIPGAIGAKMARPNQPLLLLSGDGSFGFTLGDIETAVRFGTPFVAVVASDCAWGIVAECFTENCRAGSALGEIRFDRVAQALGARGVFVEHGSQLGPAVEEALAQDAVTVIHVPVRLGGIDFWERRCAQ
jgi:acetolactate synthase-1/2/3 large subunit